MKNIYYIIWIDSIVRFRNHHPTRADWKRSIFLLNTWIHALNWWIVFIWLKYFDIINIQLIKLDLFPGALFDRFLAFCIVFASPFCILNYFLIFHNDRYKQILSRYSAPKQPYALIYSMTVAIGAFLTAILYGNLT